MKRRGLLLVSLLAVGNLAGGPAGDLGRIQPDPENPSYWEFKSRRVLLVGGSDDDNLFQWPADQLREQLDLLVSVGGNYVRNTMSDRHDKGFETYAFRKLSSGKYDLNQWNPEYWERFERFLAWTAERDIIVQIEVWDRFDYSREHWPPHPFNPRNNINYTHEESGLEAEYPEHPGQNKQPFFFTTPGQLHNKTVLKYQRAFLNKMLSCSLKFGNVLYCIDNETKAEEEWGRYWAQVIKNRAREEGVSVYVTEMWDDWNIQAERHRRTFDHPELYDFVDVSQNNHNSGEKHWEYAFWVRNYLAATPRPINTVKTYGADGNKFGHTDQDAVERFWRHLLAGFASVRFHRPDSGLGLGARAQASIRAARKLETLAQFWDLSPSPELLSEREEDEAYAAAALPGQAYVVYFTNGGSVKLETEPGRYQVSWIDIDKGSLQSAGQLHAKTTVILTPPAATGNWLAVLKNTLAWFVPHLPFEPPPPEQAGHRENLP